MSASTITILFLIFAIVSFILDASQTFSGYVNSNVILCVGMFVVGQALFETGMANKIGGVVTRFAKNEKILMVAIMVIVGVMSGFLSNTGTAAVLIPVVCGIADESGYSRSRLLMPLVFAAALGGNLSIIGAPGNLMGVDALQNLGEETGFFMYAPIGIPMLLAGIVYFVFIGYRLLPKTSAKSVAEVAETKPDILLVIDALAARNSKRLNRTIQIADTGINPGSGVGNHRNAITEKTVGIPVIAIGVPTVVDAATIVGDTMDNLLSAVEVSESLKGMASVIKGYSPAEKYELIKELIAPHLNGMFVTPKDIDETVRRISYTISEALNMLFAASAT